MDDSSRAIALRAARPSDPRQPRVWTWLATAAALLAALGNGVALAAPSTVYGKETPVLADASIAQDLVNLLVVAPLLLMLGRRARRGDDRAFLGWLGCLAFTVYNYAIYTFSVHFGPLFLVWVGVLGLSLFALMGALGAADFQAIAHRFAGRSRRMPAGVLIGVATLFMLLWLAEIVPDLLAHRASTSASTWNVPTNPVHVLDLAFYLPATVVSSVLLLRRHPAGYVTAPGLLTWLALTCLPILLTPLVADARGHASSWAVTVPISIVLLVTVGALVQLLHDHEGRDGNVPLTPGRPR